MFITTLKIILNFLYLLLLVTTILIVYAFVRLYSGEPTNIPLFIYVLFQYGINILLVVILRRSVANLNIKKLSKLNGYDDISKQLKDIETHILKSFTNISLQESKKQFEKQYNELTGRVTQPEHTPFIIPSIDAEVIDKDDSFAEFDYNLEGYANIAKSAITNDWQEGLQSDFTAESYTLEQMTVVELKELCKLYGIVGYSKLKKAELIEALTHVVK